jgi:diguanylate cyclase (GGDEF)-like protein
MGKADLQFGTGSPPGSRQPLASGCESADLDSAFDLLLEKLIVTSDYTSDCIFVVDADWRFRHLNRLAEQEIARGQSLVGRDLWDAFPALGESEFGRAYLRAMVDQVPQAAEAYYPCLASWYEAQARPACGGLLVSFRNINQRKSAEEQTRWAANHDALTGLPNRACFQSHLSETVLVAAAAEQELALLQLDLDHFKEVNDTLGHDAGDALLQAFADRLESCVRASDIVARFGGDEFAIILPGCGADEALAAADKIIDSLRSPFIHEGWVIDCGASIGTSVFPMHGEHPQELLKSADMALYAAKADGRGTAKMFESKIRDTLQKRVSMLSLGRDALRGRQIFPYYQPKIDLITGEVAGFEALLRWHHPRFGVCSPGTIAACFDDFGLATEISDRMIDCALADMRAWLDQGLSFGSVALNAGAAEFRTGRLAESILEQLARSGVPTSRFQLEVTETVFLGAGAESVERDLKMLSAAGVRIALDDFGTGYASLSHLRQFPVDIIKIDRSFISEMQQRPDDAAIVSAIINLGQNLGMDVVAEGIEHADQERQLRQKGCAFGQGFLYSKAFPASEMGTFLRQHSGTQPTP